MEPEPTDPPTLNAKDVARVEALIDPEPLPCGGRGLTKTAPRAVRWSFGKRSTFAVARFHSGMGWPVGILRRECPLNIDRCFTHRADDPPVPPQTSEGPGPVPPDPSNGVIDIPNRALTAPSGNGSTGGVRPGETLVRGARWATGAATGGRADPAPEPQHGATRPLPSGLTPGLPPTLAPRPPAGDTPLTPERGQGPEPQPQGAGGKGTRGNQVSPRRRRRWKLPTGRGSRARAAKTTAAVAAAWALIFAASQCAAVLDRVELPDLTTTTQPVEAPTTPDPLLPTAPPETPETGPPDTYPTFTMPPPCTPSDCPSLDRDR